MKVVGLISGGKDSIYNLLQCIAAGHEIVAVANIEPLNKEELDSYMYQSVGNEAISLVAAALGLPIFRQITKGSAVCKDKTYSVTVEDEVEDMLTLLIKVKKNILIEGVAVGAIASDYQRTRVENVCERLGLKCLAYLWRRDQGELLEEMIHSGLDAILVKVAGMGLNPDLHLGAHIREIKNSLFELNRKYGINICGEGGEYETLTLDCPLFTKVLKITEYDSIIISNNPFAPVGILNVRNAVLKPKDREKDPVLSQLNRIKYIQKHVKNPYFYVQDCLTNISDYMITKDQISKSTTDQAGSLISFSREFQKMPQISRSKLNTRSFPSIESISNDTSICNLNYSTGWYFIGNATGPTVAHTLACVQKHLSRTNFDFADVVLVELFVRDMSEFESMNVMYSQFMPKILPPVRICIEACLTPNIGVMANIIAQKLISKSRKALINSVPSEKETLHVQSISHWAPANIGPYSQCIKVGSVYYVAGQIPLIPGSMEILSESIFSQCRLTLRHILRILKAMTPTLTYANALQAICYVTSEQTSSIMVSMWSFITENSNTTVASVIVNQLPRKAELEWQVIACALDNPEVNEKTEIVGDYKVYMKRCAYKTSLISSLVCKVSQAKKRQKQKSDINLKFEPVENLVSVLKNSIRFLIADLQFSGIPLCMLKLFHKLDDVTVVNVVNEISKPNENYKVTSSNIPVLGCESPDICLTITGICH